MYYKGIIGLVIILTIYMYVYTISHIEEFVTLT